MTSKSKTTVAQLPPFEHEIVANLDVLFSYAVWMTGSAEESSMLVRETCNRVLWGDRKPTSPTDTRILMLRVMRELLTDHQRSAGIAGTWDRSVGPIGHRSRVTRRISGSSLQQALAALPENQRSMLVLSTIADLSCAEIARIVDSSVEEVRQGLSNGRQSLRRGLSGASPSPTPVVFQSIYRDGIDRHKQQLHAPYHKQ